MSWWDTKNYFTFCGLKCVVSWGDSAMSWEECAVLSCELEWMSWSPYKVCFICSVISSEVFLLVCLRGLGTWNMSGDDTLHTICYLCVWTFLSFLTSECTVNFSTPNTWCICIQSYFLHRLFPLSVYSELPVIPFYPLLLHVHFRSYVWVLLLPFCVQLNSLHEIPPGSSCHTWLLSFLSVCVCCPLGKACPLVSESSLWAGLCAALSIYFHSVGRNQTFERDKAKVHCPAVVALTFIPAFWKPGRWICEFEGQSGLQRQPGLCRETLSLETKPQDIRRYKCGERKNNRAY